MSNYLSPQRRLSARAAVTYPTGQTALLQPGDLISLTLSEGAEDGLLPGDAISASCTLAVDASGGAWSADLTGARLEIELAEGGEWSNLGVFFVETQSRAVNSPVLTLTARDALCTGGALPFSDALVYPRTLSDVWSHAAAQGGFDFSGAVPNGACVIDAKPDWGEITVRRALAFIAAAAGCFARVDRAGALEICPLVTDTSPYSIPDAAHFSREISARTYGPVNALDISTVNKFGDIDSTPAQLSVSANGTDARRALAISGNPLFMTGASHLPQLAAATLSRLQGLTYSSARFEYRGDPALKPGARVSIGGETLLLSRQTFELASGLSAECVCGCPDVEAIAARAISPGGGVDAGRVTGVISGGNIAANAISSIKIAAGAITAEKIAASAITAEKLSAGAVEADKLAANAVSAEKIASNAVTAGKIAAAAVESDKIAANAVTANAISTGAVTAEKCVAGLISADSALIAVGAIQTAQLADASVTAAKIVSLNADVINAGTLSAERLLLVGEGGVVYRINAAASGLSAQELSADDYKNHIDGSVIVAGSVTAAQIAAGTITANQIAANAITAEKINIAELFASTGTINAIKTMQVASLVAGTTVEITENVFRVRSPLTEIALPGAEEGEELVSMDENGLFASVITSPSVVAARGGGDFTVGPNGDFATLSDAFSALENKSLTGDIALILARASDPGGSARGLGGAGTLRIVAANMFDPLDPAVKLTSATVAAIDGGVRVTPASTGGAARYDIGRVGDIGAKGRTVYVESEVTSGGEIAFALLADDMETPLANVNITENAFAVPLNIADNAHLAVTLTVGASAADFALAVGYSQSALSAPCRPRVAKIEVEGSTALVNISHIALPDGVNARRAVISAQKCALGGEMTFERSDVVISDCVGVASTNARASRVYFEGGIPGGAREGGQIYLHNIHTLADEPTAPEASGSAVCAAIATGTYTTRWWTDDQSVRQGRTSTHDCILGGMWFDMSALPTGATAGAARLTLSRVPGYGVGSSVAIKVCGTSSNARSGEPTLSGECHFLGNLDAGATRTFELPAALVQGLSSGTYKGIVLKSDDYVTMTGKTYSRNFCRVAGTDSNLPPKLTVDYTA